MNVKTLILVTVIGGMVSSTAVAIVFGGSNLDIFGYPSHTCSPPYSKPIKPYTFNDQWEIDSYNSKIRNYNSEMESFRNCIQDYVDNAKNDMERIKENANAAINDANSQ